MEFKYCRFDLDFIEFLDTCQIKAIITSPLSCVILNAVVNEETSTMTFLCIQLLHVAAGVCWSVDSAYGNRKGLGAQQ